MSEANRVRIAIREHDTSGPWQVMRRTDDGLTPSPDTEESNEITTDRQLREVYQVGLSAEGNVDIEFSAQTFDEILSAAMCSDWDDGKLLIGTATKSFDIIKTFYFDDTEKHVVFRDMHVDSFSLSIETASIVTGSIQFAGTDVEPDYDASGDTFDEPTATPVINAATQVGSIMMNGQELEGTAIESMEIEINNNHEAQPGIGRLTAYQQTKGSASITGSKTMVFTSDAYYMWKATISNESVSSSFAMSDGETEYTIFVPREKLSGDLPSGARDETLSVELSSTATYSDSEGSALVITKTDLSGNGDD